MPRTPSYKNAIQFLYSLEKYGIRLGLDCEMALLGLFGNPQDSLNIIHVAGTNGKGSTSAMIAAVLSSAGYKTGLYTSPHLIKLNERIKINGRDITDKKLAELVERIRWLNGAVAEGQQNMAASIQPSAFSPQPTFFEFTTAMAFLYFAEEKADFAVMETGLGGRLDATNVCTPLVSIITNIEKDHEAILGSRIRDIAYEKAGIIKKGGVLITAEAKPAALKILTAECKKKRSVFYRLNKDFFVDENQGVESGRFIFTGRRRTFKNLKTNLHGRHQLDNAACALAALEVIEERGYSIPESALRKGLKNVNWPGRFEIYSKRPCVIFDCAHNPAGAVVLKAALTAGFGFPAASKRLFLVLGIMSDKDMDGIISALAPLAYKTILTRPDTGRAASLNILGELAQRYSSRIILIEKVKDACAAALSQAAKDDVICVAGSVWTVGEAKEFFIRRELNG